MFSNRWLAVAAVAATAGLAVGSSAVGDGPARAAERLVRVAGNFVGDERTEIFEYRSGSGADYLFADFSKESGFVTYTPYSFTVTGTYAPYAGDFDGDGYDELLWYGGGESPDYIWKFTSTTTFTQTAISIGSLYLAVIGDFTADGAEDILWYAPGATADRIWEFDPGSLDHTVHPISINGEYVPLAGNFTGDGATDVVFYGEGSKPDYLYDFNPGSLVPASSQFGPITRADYRPVTLDSRNDGWTDIFWYEPGAGEDPYWDFTPGGVQRSIANVQGRYAPIAGDLFGDGCEDVFWFGSSSSIWDWAPAATGGVTLTRWDFG